MDDTTRAFLSALTAVTSWHGSLRVQPAEDGDISLVVTEHHVHRFANGTTVDLQPGDAITLQVVKVETS